MKTCLHCGKEFGVGVPPSKLKRNKYCSYDCAMAHRRIDNPRKIRVAKTCEFCREEFTCTSAAFKRRHFCSQTCANRANQPITAQKTCVCNWCGKDFVTWNSRQGRFCSRQCSSEFGAHQPKPNARRADLYVTLYCEQCNKEYVTTVHQVKYRNSRFCSVPCRGRWVSENRVGVNHPMFKGGTDWPDRGLNWVAQRRAALQRDGHKCVICGRKAKRGEKRVLSVHHIIPYRQFKGDWLAANQLTNLITLCRHCHTQVEDYGFPCPKPLF